MEIILNQSDLDNVSNGTREEIVSLILARPALTTNEELDERYHGIDMTDVVDLTVAQVHEFVKGASRQTVRGLRALAEDGPAISVVTLNAALQEVREELGHERAMAPSQFQSRTTRRTRTVAGRGDIWLLGWNDWHLAETDHECLYAVTPTTYESLKRYFADSPR